MSKKIDIYFDKNEYAAYDNSYIDDVLKDIFEKYIFVNAPIYNKMIALRNEELRDIYLTCTEFKKFKESLPEDQHITVDGYLIYRTVEVEEVDGLPGFASEIQYNYKYDNPAEDITFLFGSKEYCDKMRELEKQLVSWDKFIKTYYE